MGKLNYTNRKVEGLKLGHIVAKDIIKRMPPGSSSNAASRDPGLELNIAGKHLSDNGLQEAASALSSALEAPEACSHLRLEELGLSENDLTAASLLPLASVVRLAFTELKDIDLSSNQISIITDSDAVAWETFLEAFQYCFMLRRLDLSGNPLGSRAFEILARVYSKECLTDTLLQGITGPIPDIDTELAQKANSLDVSESNGSSETKRKRSHTRSSSITSLLAPPEPLTIDVARYPTMYGLRAIPYIVLANTSMTDLCSLHLSYVLAAHNQPELLLEFVPPAKLGSSLHQLEEYDKNEQCRGIIYFPNEGISSTGARLLEVSELVREDHDPGNIQSPNLDVAPRSNGRRRSSSSSHTTLDISDEIDRARNKIQGNTIRDSGVQVVDLWKVGVRMMVIARALFLEQRPKRKAPKSKTASPSPSPPIQGPPSYAAKLTTAFSSGGSPILTLTGTTTSWTPVKTKFTARKSSSSSQVVETSTPVVIKNDDEPELSPLLGHLPKKIWGRILVEAADPMRVTNEKQHEAIIDWARSRQTLGKERETLGKTESVQIWKVLEGLGCLSYDLL